MVTVSIGTVGSVLDQPGLNDKGELFVPIKVKFETTIEVPRDVAITPLVAFAETVMVPLLVLAVLTKSVPPLIEELPTKLFVPAKMLVPGPVNLKADPEAVCTLPRTANVCPTYDTFSTGVPPPSSWMVCVAGMMV